MESARMSQSGVMDQRAPRARQYIPFGGEIHAERRFGDLVLPSSASVGWCFDTPRYAPFFHAEISAVTPTL
jgi:hypothetical protein